MKNILRKASGFTLVELLVVIAILAILMGVISTGFVQARRGAKRAKAEAEIRSLVTAWGQWFQLYGEDYGYAWPSAVDGQSDIKMNFDNLGPIISADDDDNPKGIVLLNVSIEKTGRNPQRLYLDPWGNAYEMTFDRTEEIEQTLTITSSIHLPNALMVQ